MNKAPTIAEQAPQTLWQFLALFPGSFEAQLFLGLMMAGTVGMFCHYALKWARGEIKGGLLCYFADNFRSTVLSFFTYVGVAITAIGGGAFLDAGGVFIGWKMVLWMGISNGFTIDAVVNRTTRAIWSRAERDAKIGGTT